MRKRIIALLLCICMASAGFVYTFAEGTDQNGDANGDGSVSVSDASLVLRYCVGLDYRMTMRGRMLADADCDGTIEAEDAAAILRHIAGLNSMQTTVTDATLFADLNKQYYYDPKFVSEPEDYSEWVARFIQSLPQGYVRKVMYAGAKYLGTPYATMDCSRFLNYAFNDAGVPKNVYPEKSSDSTLNWFRTNHPEQLHETDQYSWADWKPGCVLIYVNQTTNKASHLSLYVGEIDGNPVVMESRRHKVDGVRAGIRMSDYTTDAGDKVVLAYYVDPLG